MVCDYIDPVPNPDHYVVKVKNAQIVNGCQTSVTIREASNAKQLKDDVRVLLRIYATDNPTLSDRITLTTNSQNSITDRDLHANDGIQRDVQRIMEENFSYYFERKNKQFRTFHKKQHDRIVPNDKAAQAYLSIILRKPSVARGYLGRVWSDYYEEIFGKACVEDLLAAYLIYRYAAKRARLAKNDESLSKLRQEVAVYGAFHLARIMGSILLGDKWGTKVRKALTEFVTRIEADQEELSKAYDKAMSMLETIREASVATDPNPALYFKAGSVEKAIETAIGTSA